MKKIYLLLASLYFISGTSFSQLSVSVTTSNSNVCLGSNSTLTATAVPVGYTMSAIAANPQPSQYINVLTEAGTAYVTLNNGNLDDGRWENISIPFSFRYFGNAFSSVCISTNGWVTFGGSVGTSTGYGAALPNAGAPNNAIHVVTADLSLAGGTVLNMIEYFTIGTAPNRKFVINYEDVQFRASATTFTGQVILYETTNVVEIHTIS